MEVEIKTLNIIHSFSFLQSTFIPNFMKISRHLSDLAVPVIYTDRQTSAERIKLKQDLALFGQTQLIKL